MRISEFVESALSEIREGVDKANQDAGYPVCPTLKGAKVRFRLRTFDVASEDESGEWKHEVYVDVQEWHPLQPVECGYDPEPLPKFDKAHIVEFKVELDGKEGEQCRTRATSPDESGS